MMNRHFWRPALHGMLVLGLIAAAIATSSAAKAQQTPPAELTAAIESYVESRGWAYAGDCSTTQTGEYAGQYCSTILSLTDDAATVSIGRVLSDETHQVSFEKANGSWQVKAGPEVPADLTAAIKAYVESRGWTYTGDCSTTQTGEHAGKHCSTVVSITADTAVVSIGRVLSDEIMQVTFKKVDGAWKVPSLGTATPRAPESGVGDTDGAGSGTGTLRLAAGILAVVMVLGAVGWSLSSRRKPAGFPPSDR